MIPALAEICQAILLGLGEVLMAYAGGRAAIVTWPARGHGELDVCMGI